MSLVTECTVLSNMVTDRQPEESCNKLSWEQVKLHLWTQAEPGVAKKPIKGGTQNQGTAEGEGDPE